MTTLLSDTDLQELTSYKQGAAQAKFLAQAYGLNVPRRPDGKVRVTWDVINQAMNRAKPSVSTEPRWTK